MHAGARARIRSVVRGESFANPAAQACRAGALQRGAIRPREHGDARIAFAAQNQLVDEWRELTQELRTELSAADPGAAAELEFFCETTRERQPLFGPLGIVKDREIAHAVEAFFVAALGGALRIAQVARRHDG